MKRVILYILLLTGTILLASSASAQNRDRATVRLEKKALRKSGFVPSLFADWHHLGPVKVDSIAVEKEQLVLHYYLSAVVTQIPIRTSWLTDLRSKIGEGLGRPFRNYRIQLWARGRLLEEYIPNAYRDSLQRQDKNRLAAPYPGPPLVTRLNKQGFTQGLQGRHIALWPSHGLFFDQVLDRWQWQRARLWQTVEDIFPWSFTSAYLVPMLENAGATVLLPRERDTQIREVIVDNDTSTGNSRLVLTNGANTWQKNSKPGFLMADTLFEGQNPFTRGTSLMIETFPGDTASLSYIPDIPEAGNYAVYVTWAKSNQCLPRVRYEVNHTGGKTVFEVNQCMGDGTWIYLGTFDFKMGIHQDAGSVKVVGGMAGGILTADAVRFGGGMGNVARKPEDNLFRYKLSDRPRWMEGSRYYLQYAGMPDTLVYNLNKGRNDYNDDYMSRGEWVNYLIGSSRPQYNDKYADGLNIPVDLALAFHTDAGVTGNDSVIGTLGIYSTVRNNGLFPDGRSKLTSRDLTDIVQTEVVEDIRTLVEKDWTRRGLWDREYSEAWRPIVPVMLLELMSHQNLADMKFGLDPRFKFIVARAVYKGIARFSAVQNGLPLVIQPLPPDHMAIELLEELTIKVRWQPVADPLEATAKPTGYMVYRKDGDQGFDNGVYTRDTFLIVNLVQQNRIVSFRVTALNNGGESMPGEVLSVGLATSNAAPVLVVNAFDRICAPAFFDKGDMAGIAWWEDEGVPHGKEMGFTGHMVDFDRNSSWLHDDSPGWGASSADMENQGQAGNTFSYPLIHGKALLSAGYSFTSVSDEVFESPGYDGDGFSVVDLIFGEERGTASLNNPSTKDFRVLTPAMMKAIMRHTARGGNVFMSGAHIGTDMVENNDSVAIQFAADVLHYSWRTDHATQKGDVYPTDQALHIFPDEIKFNTGDDPDIYRVESPDAIEPSGKGAFRIFRYRSGNCSAGVAYQGAYRTVVLGFPFETIAGESRQFELMRGIMNFFNFSE